MSEEKQGIKETKEALVGFISLAAMLAEVFKDGVQASDIAAVIVKIQGSPELQMKLLEAYNGIDKLPAEVKDIDLGESIDLVISSLPEIKKLIEVIKAPKVA